MIELICADSMQIMEGMRGRVKPSFDCIFLDPPCFEWADRTPLPSHNKLSYLAHRLLKPNGCVFLCGTQPQLVNNWRYWNRFFNLLFELSVVKSAGTPPMNMKQPIRLHENVWCLWRKKDNFLHLKVDISRATSGRRRKRSGMYMPTRYGKERKTMYVGVGYPKSVVKVRKIDVHSKEYEGHPAQKPIKLMRLLVKIATEEGDWILDPFAGVGTTMVACEELNRNCLAIEINPLYIRLYKRRRQRRLNMKKLERWIE